MKKLLTAVASFLLISSVGYPHMGESHDGEKGDSGAHMGMMKFMMHDPELRKIIREHRKKCMQELMEKLHSRPAFQERMIRMILKHPEAARKALENNPELRKRLEELLR